MENLNTNFRARRFVYIWGVSAFIFPFSFLIFLSFSRVFFFLDHSAVLPFVFHFFSWWLDHNIFSISAGEREGLKKKFPMAGNFNLRWYFRDWRISFLLFFTLVFFSSSDGQLSFIDHFLRHFSQKTRIISYSFIIPQKFAFFPLPPPLFLSSSYHAIRF